MGQYYNVVFVDGKNNVKKWVCTIQCGAGSKLMEHAFISNGFMNAIEHLLGPDGSCYMSRIVWAGDYADNEDGTDKNLHIMAEQDLLHLQEVNIDMSQTDFKYIVNHTKKVYVDKSKYREVHPLPLLVAEGNGMGGGDYYGENATFCGMWARNIISMEIDAPVNYTECVIKFE
jgi:hypothetical protein